VHPANEAWAAVLRELRVARDLLRTEVAAATGLQWQCVDKIEKNACCPRLDSLLKICDALGVPFVAVALVVELRLEGCVVPLARVLRLLPRWRRLFRQGTDSGPSA
jgi:DNA-binding XRE family transcriptional regulator